MDYSIEACTAENGACPYQDWLASLDKKTRGRVEARILRLRMGNFGDWKAVGEGVSELRLPFGAGYHVYYEIVENRVVLLISGGSKRTQKRDIRAAQEVWKNYQKR
ncbi:MAG: type II toxin-antitoxin system RelE/ParE family toxin [Geitlerinemataceae cyanobacterium]